MIVYPDIDPIAFRLGPIKVHWYGIMYLLGFAAGWLLARRRAARPGSTWNPWMSTISSSSPWWAAFSAAG